MIVVKNVMLVLTGAFLISGVGGEQVGFWVLCSEVDVQVQMLTGFWKQAERRKLLSECGQGFQQED